MAVRNVEARFADWADGHGLEMSPQAFRKAMKQLGFSSIRGSANGSYVYRSLTLTEDASSMVSTAQAG